MSGTRPTDEAVRLFEEIRELRPHEQLHLAADLLDNKRPLTALLIVRKVVSDLEALHAAGRL